MVTVKLDVTSSRVKGVAFHPKLPLLLTSLHSGEIQLWDYDKSILLDTLEGHVGPVRGVDFHSRESLFVSGGDDCQVVVWDFKFKRRLFALSGHSDYVRTVCFHHRHPWIVSASDDQTFRVWNWQSRSSIYVITGHCHYVMCAKFHPTKDLLLTSSLDHTARVWNTPSDLDTMGRNKQVYEMSRHDSMDEFGLNSPFTLRFLLEGHEKGVNCGVFHPYQQLIVTCSDDKTIRVWRYTEDSVWQANVLRSHTDNVSCVMYHPGDVSILVSDSEDCSVKFWGTENWECLYTFKRKGDRFWTLGCTEYMGSRYIAAGHDSGYVLLKLMSERPLILPAKNGGLYFLRRDIDEPGYGLNHLFINDPTFTLYLYNVNGEAQYAMQLKIPGRFTREKLSMDISTRPFQILLLSRNSKRLAIFYNLPELESGRFKIQSAKRMESVPNGEYSLQFYELPQPFSDPICCCFMGKKRIAVGTTNHLVILNCRFEKVASFELPTERVYPAPDGAVFAVSQSSLYHVKESIIMVTTLTGKPISIQFNKGRHLVVCRNSISVLDERLRVISLIYDNRIKSALWDGFDSVVYTTSTHLKFFTFTDSDLPNEFVKSDCGVLRTLDSVWYLASLSGDELRYFTRDHAMGRLRLDMPEYRARIHVSGGGHISNLFGATYRPSMNFIGFLRDRGYSKHAFGLCRDRALKFSLAKSHCNLDEMVSSLEGVIEGESWLTGAWHDVATTALKQCNIEIAERGYKRVGDTNGLIHLYMLTGQFDKLLNIHGSTNASLYLNGIDGLNNSSIHKFGMFRPIKIWNGWSNLIDWSKLIEVDITPPTIQIEKSTPKRDAWSALDDFIEEIESSKTCTEIEVIETDDVSGRMIEDLTMSQTQSQTVTASQTTSPSMTICEMIIHGHFESALNEMRRRLSLSNSSALLPSMIELYQSFMGLGEGITDTSLIVVPIFKSPVMRIVEINSNLLLQGHNMVTNGDFIQSLKIYRKIMYNSMLGWDSKMKLNESVEFIRARGYVLAMVLEIKRSELAESDVGRSLQLAASLAGLDLEDSHKFLVLRRMMGIMWKAGNFKTTAEIARRLLDAKVPESIGDSDESEKVKRILQASLKKGGDKFPIRLNGGSICTMSFDEVEDSPVVACPFCSSIAQSSFVNKLCNICQLCCLN